MFRDEAVLRATAGRGGDGCSSLHREKFQALGGPDGGDGGHGGSVILQAVANRNSLFHITRQYHARAQNGRPGESNNRTGRSGDDLLLEVPVGTQIRDTKRGNLLADLDSPGRTVTIAKGGKGGRGNARFASATNQTPRYAENGAPGEEREVTLILKLVADVGLVGLPNAGKSTLLSRLTSARPRVGAYPFTTLDPSLGMMEVEGSERIVVLADIPGLIEGAHDGKGLGHQFLRHVERTRVLLHLVDCSATAGDPLEDWKVIREELRAYSAELASRPQIVAATKVEDDASEVKAQRLIASVAEEFAGSARALLMISAVTGRGLTSLRHALFERVRELDSAS